ncbi:hypothetical protein Stsp01_20660 [Streptomyces sp. NBRC 13847]|nr:hypothetical protein Stsp01_20660 [Streptomyces sp. NBRC 13847]
MPAPGGWKAGKPPPNDRGCSEVPPHSGQSRRPTAPAPPGPALYQLSRHREGNIAQLTEPRQRSHQAQWWQQDANLRTDLAGCRPARGLPEGARRGENTSIAVDLPIRHVPGAPFQ